MRLKSAVDAVRFTAATPHAFARPPTAAASSYAGSIREAAKRPQKKAAKAAPPPSSSPSPISRTPLAVGDPAANAASPPTSSPSSPAAAAPPSSPPSPPSQGRPSTQSLTHTPSTLKVPKGFEPPVGRVETPHEKIARLRALRLKMLEVHLSPWERIVLRGRAIADRAHRVTIYFLLGFTVLCTFLAIYATTDMFVFNRRKRNAFLSEQHLIYMQRLAAAIETEKAGLPLTPDQAVVLTREKAKVASQEARKVTNWGKKVKDFFYMGVNNVYPVISDPNKASSSTTATTSNGTPVEGIEKDWTKGRIPSEGEVLKMIGIEAREIHASAVRRAAEAEVQQAQQSGQATPTQGQAVQDGILSDEAVAAQQQSQLIKGFDAAEASKSRGMINSEISADMTMITGGGGMLDRIAAQAAAGISKTGRDSAAAAGNLFHHENGQNDEKTVAQGWRSWWSSSGK